ncbi:unnamed protein product [Caenorhabditis angaria]|uniref:Transmembrane protein 144 n=1 Tax=Caenorhabditis angaria TaxID=860376 RepID=A0A9P1I346_9PELO|nr:unnamed protein product [Caenorhabditis angaria]
MSVAIGLAACAVSSLFFGSMFVPLKTVDPRDGIFAQWLMSISILLVGFGAFCYAGFPGFYPLSMLGGASWCLGNATAIPIISRLGMAISILIWNTTNCITGWAGGRFGLFGMNPSVPASPMLNYLGLICVVVGGTLFSRVKSTPKQLKSSTLKLDDLPEKEAMLSETETGTGSGNAIEVDVSSGGRIGAVVAALVAGVFYGMNFVPVIYMIDNPVKFPNQPSDGFSYVFSHYFGIFITSTILFVFYAIFKKNKPYVTPELCLPGIASGLLWAVAQTSFFIANQNLSQTVTFPIISQMPGCIAAAWSIFYYKEIEGKRNFMILGCAMSVTICGAILVGLSKAIEL